jgi:hypothetical protein
MSQPEKPKGRAGHLSRVWISRPFVSIPAHTHKAIQLNNLSEMPHLRKTNGREIAKGGHKVEKQGAR